MRGMFLLSTIVHFLFFAFFLYFPELSRKEVILTPVYTVDLLSLPESKAPPSKSQKVEPTPKEEAPKPPPPKPERKSLQFEPSSPQMETLKKLAKFEKKAGEKKEKAKEKQKEGIKENTLSDMLTELEKKWEKEKAKEVPASPPAEKAENKDLMEKLAKLEEDWSRLEEEKKTREKEEAAAKAEEGSSSAKTEKQMKLGRTKLESQTAEPTLPAHLNRYYAIILSRINENWVDPISAKLKDSKLEIPGVAFFEIKADGSVVNVGIEESSGDELLDSLVKKAIMKSSPLPPPPQEVSNGSMNVYLDFRYILEK